MDLQTDEGSIRSDFRFDIEEFDDGERVSQVLKRGGARLQIFADEGDIILGHRFGFLIHIPALALRMLPQHQRLGTSNEPLMSD